MTIIEFCALNSASQSDAAQQFGCSWCRRRRRQYSALGKLRQDFEVLSHRDIYLVIRPCASRAAASLEYCNILQSFPSIYAPYLRAHGLIGSRNSHSATKGIFCVAQIPEFENGVAVLWASDLSGRFKLLRPICSSEGDKNRE